MGGGDGCSDGRLHYYYYHHEEEEEEEVIDVFFTSVGICVYDLVLTEFSRILCEPICVLSLVASIRY